MAKRRAQCDRTLDLLEWLERQPPAVEIQRYDELRVRATTLRARIARAVAETLRDSGLGRDQVVQRMSEWLGEDVSVNMLNAYASEGREDHTVPYLRLLALVHATGDVRPLQVGAELFDHMVVSGALKPWVAQGVDEVRLEKIERLRDHLRRDVRARRSKLAGEIGGDVARLLSTLGRAA